MTRRTWILILAAALLIQGIWAWHDWGSPGAIAWAQAGATVPSPQPGTAGPTPGMPGSGSGVMPVQRFPMTLPELLWGIAQLENSGQGLSREQARKIVPALEKVVAASQQVDRIESQMKTILSDKQIQYIKEKQRSNQLELSLPPAPSPEQDPLIAEVLRRLESKAK